MLVHEDLSSYAVAGHRGPRMYVRSICDDHLQTLNPHV